MGTHSLRLASIWLEIARHITHDQNATLGILYDGAIAAAMALAFRVLQAPILCEL